MYVNTRMNEMECFLVSLNFYRRSVMEMRTDLNAELRAVPEMYRCTAIRYTPSRLISHDSVAGIM